jgi:hypothetical protein
VSQDAFQRIAPLLAAALDPDAAAERRRDAIERLQQIPGHLLRSLRSAPEGRSLADLLSGLPLAPEAHAERAAHAHPPATAVEPVGLVSHNRDLLLLINESWLLDARVPEDRIAPSSKPSTLIEQCARVCAYDEGASARTFVRQLPWVLLVHAAPLVTYRDIWKRTPSLLGAFWDECINRAPHLGTPPRLAAHLQRMIGASASRRAWFDRAAEWVEESLRQTEISLVETHHLRDIHFSLRTGMAGWIRRAEIMDPHLIAAMEIYTTSRLLKYLCQQDLKAAWEDSGQDPEQATRLWTKRNSEASLLWINAIENLTSEQTFPAEHISRFDRQALQMVQQVAGRDPELRRSGIFAAE